MIRKDSLLKCFVAIYFCYKATKMGYWLWESQKSLICNSFQANLSLHLQGKNNWQLLINRGSTLNYENDLLYSVTSKLTLNLNGPLSAALIIPIRRRSLIYVQIIYKFASIFGDSDVPVGVVTTKKWALIQTQQTFHQDYHLSAITTTHATYITHTNYI